MLFSEALYNFITGQGSVSDITVYIESGPHPEVIFPHNVIIASAGDTLDERDRGKADYRRRLLISGSAQTSLTKAEEIRDMFVPRHNQDMAATWTKFLQNGYFVHKIFIEKDPSLVENYGNIFFADMILRFMTAKSN